MAGSPAATTVDWVADEAGFAALAEPWDALLTPDSHPFDLHCWYAAWWKAFGGDRQLAVCVVRRGHQIVAVAPLMRDSSGRILAMANEQSSMFRLLAVDADARRALARALLERRAPELFLSRIPADEPIIGDLCELGRSSGRLVASEPEHVSPIVDTSGDFDAWRADSKRRWGAPLERFRRKMQRDYDAEMTIVEPPVDLDGELAAGLRVEASGWKGQAGTAILCDPATHAFYVEMSRAFHERGALRLSRIVLDGRTAAFDLCLLDRGRLYLVKTAFDEDFRKLAPGLVLRLSTVERCFELGLEAHELLGHRSEWKAKFATRERPHVGVRAYPRRPLGVARYAYRTSIRPPLRRAYRRVRARG
ncbi:MAG TPA: GNAT family N-acetyltransferase [Thermoleophilaceae bacterium]|nr:GNAT family N-acetyltransferase [Thermoleophilaceae bacterium]